MKNKKEFVIIFCALILFFSCSNQKTRMLELWDIEKNVDYVNFTSKEKETIEKLLYDFSLEEKKDKKNWNSGYSQQCYIIRRLYFSEITEKKEFLDSCIEVYKRFESNKKTISFHTAGYAVCLYYNGYEEEAKKLFSEILEKTSVCNFSNQDEYNLVIATCNKILGKKNTYNSEITSAVYEMTDDEIISTFCGN